jgi:large subunit ribosomal protein L30
MADAAMLKLTLVRSPITTTQRQRATLRTLGLTRVGKTVIVRDDPPARGRIRAVAHLVEVNS